MLVLVREHQDGIPPFHGWRDEREAVLVVPHGGSGAGVARQTQHLVRFLVLDVVVEKHHVVLGSKKFSIGKCLKCAGNQNWNVITEIPENI